MKHKTLQGTITWFEIAKGELPPVGEERFNKQNKWSDKVLLLNRQNGSIGLGHYIYGAEMFSHGSGNWNPTHWAFINLPEKTTA